MFFVTQELTHPSRLGVSKRRWSLFQVTNWFIYHPIYLLLGDDMMDLMTKQTTNNKIISDHVNPRKKKSLMSI